MLTRLLGSLYSPGGSRGGLSILVFHRVLPQRDEIFPDEPDAARFDTLLNWVGASFSVLPLERAIADLAAARLPPRALSITFDDGYADNFTTALPLLQKHGMCATFFVACGFLDGGRMWNDTLIEAVRAVEFGELDLHFLGLDRHSVRSSAEKRATIERLLPKLKYLPLDERAEKIAAIVDKCRVSLRDDLMMTTEQMRALRAAGMEIGGHTCRHPILGRLEDEEAFSEIAEGKRRLEAALGESVNLFAYPNGKPGVDYDGRHVRMVRRAGFKAAVSTAPGVGRPGGDMFQLPRFTPWDRTRMRFGLRLVNNMRVSNLEAV